MVYSDTPDLLEDNSNFGDGLEGMMELEEFFALLETQEGATNLRALVDISSLEPQGDGPLDKSLADQVKDLSRDYMEYRFMYVFHVSFLYCHLIFDSYDRTYKRRKDGYMRFRYHCAQLASRQSAPRKRDGPGIQNRDKLSMSTFDCDGWLNILISEDRSSAIVEYRHACYHVSYCNIDLPDWVRAMIHPDRTVKQVITDCLP